MNNSMIVDTNMTFLHFSCDSFVAEKGRTCFLLKYKVVAPESDVNLKIFSKSIKNLSVYIAKY
jgi:hypothetical protein